ncbi:MAG: hypothetical protein ACRDTD_03395 [Pseudonocardiaceae bacterium]
MTAAGALSGVASMADVLAVEQTGDPGGQLVQRFDWSLAAAISLLVAVIAIGVAISPRRASVAFPNKRKVRGTGMRSVAGWPERPEQSEATRLLCAAAYRDERFANAVVENLLADDLAAIAPSVGVDLRPVLLHCLASSKRRRDRDIGLTVTLLLSILLALFSLGFVVIGLAVAGALVLSDQRWQHRTMSQRLYRANFRRQPNPPEPPESWVANRLADIAGAQQGNVTVYSGYRPFIGYGGSVSGWSFALPVLPVTELDGRRASKDVTPFTAAELTEHVHRALSDVVDKSGAARIGERLEGLHLEERVFVDGAGLDVDGPFLLDREVSPTTSLSTDDLAAIAADPRGVARYYLCAHVPSWGGQIVASTFLRLSTDGHLLYAVCEHTVLAPVDAAYLPNERTTDKTRFRERASAVGRSVRDVVPMLLLSPWRVIRVLDFPDRCARRADRARKQAVEDLDFDYGASFSVRESFTDDEYHNYYQQADAIKHLKIVERHLLEAIAVFLEGHHVDTTELRNRQTAILNEGIIQTGGTSNIGVQAVGRGAAAAQNSPDGASKPAAQNSPNVGAQKS